MTMTGSFSTFGPDDHVIVIHSCYCITSLSNQSLTLSISLSLSLSFTLLFVCVQHETGVLSGLAGPPFRSVFLVGSHPANSTESRSYNAKVSSKITIIYITNTVYRIRIFGSKHENGKVFWAYASHRQPEGQFLQVGKVILVGPPRRRCMMERRVTLVAPVPTWQQ